MKYISDSELVEVFIRASRCSFSESDLSGSVSSR